MPKRQTNLLIPGMATPEGAARIQREMAKRDEIDFRAFQMLRRLVNEEGFLHPHQMQNVLISDGESKEDAKQMAKEIYDEIDEIIRARGQADHDVLQAAAGRE